MCRVLKVSASGFYDWQGRQPCARAKANAELTKCIRQVHADSDATYGMPRIRAELVDQGIVASRKRIARLMRAAGLRGVSRRRGFTITTERDGRQRPAPDLVQRQFTVDAPDQLWVADMTYIPTWAGFVYLAMVLDACSRKVVGWAIGEEMTAQLVVSASNMALATRKPDSVIHHSDQGSQYISLALPASALRQGTRFNLSLLAVQAALGGQGIAMGRLALVLGYLLKGRLVVPFRQRVLSRASYRFIGSPSHPEMPTILDWLVDEAIRFKQQRDAFFESAKISVA